MATPWAGDTTYVNHEECIIFLLLADRADRHQLESNPFSTMNATKLYSHPPIHVTVAAYDMLRPHRSS